ncbi:EVE domain-containing protein [Nocardia sp. BMG111209]|uniref:EVE domain-containing protein n=1 Tax=Nocardia sp. BMG111209 TaxID=1160137 RepID=UPI00036119C3|nr:EVE domain-containing protein [Nocardia sp. BMG111209]
MTRYWLAVVSRDHVHRARELGIAQANHGKRTAVERMGPGDGLVYYSPRTGIRAGEQIRAFTALGSVDAAEPWQADDQGGGFRPWRRAVTYRDAAQEVPIDTVRGELELTAVPNWGIVLRRGLIELGEHDFAVIERAMVGE